MVERQTHERFLREDLPHLPDDGPAELGPAAGGAEDDRAALRDELAQILDLGRLQREVIVAGHVQDGDVHRVEAGAGQRLGGVLVVVAVGQALVGQRDKVLGIVGVALPLLELLHGAVGVLVLEDLAVLDLVDDGQVGGRRRRAHLGLAHAGTGVDDDVGFLAACLGLGRGLGGRWRRRLRRREGDDPLAQSRRRGKQQHQPGERRGVSPPVQNSSKGPGPAG
jgi:hypothetical protein